MSKTLILIIDLDTIMRRFLEKLRNKIPQSYNFRPQNVWHLKNPWLALLSLYKPQDT